MQNGIVLWFTGLSGAGKTTISKKIYKILKNKNIKAHLIDSDNIPITLEKEGIFTEKDRKRNRDNVMEKARKLSNDGYIVMVSFISPFKSDRELAKKIIGEKFIEIYVKASIESCKKRDPKGLYKKAEKGILFKFPGIDIEYEIPDKPDIIIYSDKYSADYSANRIVEFLLDNTK